MGEKSDGNLMYALAEASVWLSRLELDIANCREAFNILGKILNREIDATGTRLGRGKPKPGPEVF